jgi:hypothetical protein
LSRVYSTIYFLPAEQKRGGIAVGYGGEYRIYLYREDESLSFVMALYARADMDAKDQAEKMLKDGLVRAEIWRDEIKVATLDHRTIPPSAASDQWVPELWRISF